MSLATDINALLTGDPTLAALVTNDDVVDIWTHHLPDNLAVDKSCIVFTYKQEEGVSTLNQTNVLEIYSLYIIGIAPDTDITDAIYNAIRNILDDYTGGSIRQSRFNGDLSSTDEDKERYLRTLEYRIIYT